MAFLYSSPKEGLGRCPWCWHLAVHGNVGTKADHEFESPEVLKCITSNL